MGKAPLLKVLLSEAVEELMDLAVATAGMLRRLMLPLLVAACCVVQIDQAAAQGAFPAPLPTQSLPANDPAFPPVNAAPRATDPAFPPVNAAPRGSIGSPSLAFPGAASPGALGGGFQPAPQAAAPPEDCMKGFLPLREEAEKRGKLISGAKSAEEACKRIQYFGEAEVKMLTFVEKNAAKCGIPPQVPEQLKTGHERTKTMQQKTCAVAQQQQQGPAGPSLSEVLGSAATLPDATTVKKGGSTFDTLNGNVLTR
jgi:hypothetical protein